MSYEVSQSFADTAAFPESDGNGTEVLIKILCFFFVFVCDLQLVFFEI